MQQEHFEDFSEYKHRRYPELPNVRNIGWLAKSACFPSGDLPIDFHEKIEALYFDEINGTMACIRMLGSDDYECNIDEKCDLLIARPNGGKATLGWVREIWIPDGDVVYAAPGLIVHYTRAHNYLPPASFVDAVMRIDESTCFNAFVYRFQLLRHLKGAPPLTMEELFRMELVDSLDHELWCSLPAPHNPNR